MDQNFDAKRLYKKFLEETATSAEIEMLLEYLEHSSEKEINALILDELEDDDILGCQPEIAHLYPKIQARIQPIPAAKPSISRYKRWLPYAAAAIVLFALGLYWYNTGEDVQTSAIVAGTVKDIGPGGNKAYITFSNGLQVELDSAQSGLVTRNGKYSYTDGEELTVQHMESATVRTPVGGTYQITLPDGTKAWLNAASALTYPTQFDKERREVILEGEGYFEVSKDPNRPFIVTTKSQKVQVLGTRFNINAYNDEVASKTTLVEGSVRVSATNTKHVTLNPNEQAVYVNGMAKVVAVDASEYISWTKGEIVLTNLHLPEVLRQLERWYDVRFEYSDKGLSDKTVFGVLDRSLPLSDILKSLEKSYNIKFKREGRRVNIEVD